MHPLGMSMKWFRQLETLIPLVWVCLRMILPKLFCAYSWRNSAPKKSLRQVFISLWPQFIVLVTKFGSLTVKKYRPHSFQLIGWQPCIVRYWQDKLSKKGRYLTFLVSFPYVDIFVSSILDGAIFFRIMIISSDLDIKKVRSNGIPCSSLQYDNISITSCGSQTW